MTLLTPEKTYQNKEERIRITETLLECQGRDYPIRHIEKWRQEKDTAAQSTSALDFIPLGGLLLLAIWVFGQTTLILPQVLLLGLVALLMASGESTAYKLIVTTDQGEEITLKAGNKKELKKMQSVLEAAIAHLKED